MGGSDDEAADTDRCLARAPPGRRLEFTEYLFVADDDSLYRYRSRKGEILTEEDMEAIFGDDITGLEVEDREEITFESWLAAMIDCGRYSRVYEDDD